MKTKQLIVTLSLLLQAIVVFAQHNNSVKEKNSKFQFHSINSIGLLEGEAGSAFQLQTVNGFQYKAFFAGLGIGIDYYSVRSIPLFLALRKYIDLKKGFLYGYGDAGIHFVWQRKYDATLQALADYDNGLYYDIGLGYKLPVNKNNAFTLSAGFTEKQYATNIDQVHPCLIPPCPVSKRKYNYSLHRLSVKAGWTF